MEPSKRLLSLDVFRGLTIAAMILVNNPGDWGNIYAPLRHAAWHGCTPTDWIFPFFLFIVGVAISIALGKRKDRGDSPAAMYRKIGYRAAVIFGLGVFLAAFPHFRFEGPAWLRNVHYVLLSVAMLAVFLREIFDQELFQGPGYQNARKWLGYVAVIAAGLMAVIGLNHYYLGTLRIPGVLQRIAIVYALASLLFLHYSPRVLFGVAVVLLLGYWGLMTLVPVPGGLAPNLEPGTNLAAWSDRTVFGIQHLWSQSKTWDPEGFLSTIPAMGTAIAGILTGELLRSSRTGTQKVVWMLISGVILIALGQLWNLVFPINKALWTSSYVLYVGGLAQVFLGAAYWLIDLKGIKAWSKPFEIYGVNALFAFVLSGVLAKLISAMHWQVDAETTQTVRGWLYDTLFTPYFSAINASLGFAILHIAFIFLCSWALYRYRIFIKV